jgi:two-component system response regulator (stage 0 sporulation protein F)
MSKRVLIVDDEESLTYFLGENLAGLSLGYEVETARSGKEALAKISQQPFDLVITDFLMPDLDGLELIEQIRVRHPQTHLILMTAYGNDQVEAEARRLEVYRYITKPFQVEELVTAVRQALGETIPSLEGSHTLTEAQLEAITKCLTNLRFEVGAQCIILADAMGQLVNQVGTPEELDVPTIVSLAGGSFATTSEMTRHLQEKGQTFNLNYHEGAAYHIYSANVGNNLVLTVIFDRRASPSRIGTVWLYTKQAIKRLLEITATEETIEPTQIPEVGLEESISQALDNLLSEAERQK